MKSKIVATLLLVACLTGIASSPLGIELCRWAFAAGVETILREPVQLAPPNFYFVGASAYHVDFWCTPTVLWLGATLLLFVSRPDVQTFTRGVALVLPLGALAMVLNVVFSIALHQRGLNWTWAHYPGLFLVYSVVFLVCLRREKRNVSREKTAATSAL